MCCHLLSASFFSYFVFDDWYFNDYIVSDSKQIPKYSWTTECYKSVFTIYGSTNNTCLPSYLRKLTWTLKLYFFKCSQMHLHLDNILEHINTDFFFNVCVTQSYNPRVLRVLRDNMVQLLCVFKERNRTINKLGHPYLKILNLTKKFRTIT